MKQKKQRERNVYAIEHCPAERWTHHEPHVATVVTEAIKVHNRFHPPWLRESTISNRCSTILTRPLTTSAIYWLPVVLTKAFRSDSCTYMYSLLQKTQSGHSVFWLITIRQTVHGINVLLFYCLSFARGLLNLRFHAVLLLKSLSQVLVLYILNVWVLDIVLILKEWVLNSSLLNAHAPHQVHAVATIKLSLTSYDAVQSR